MTCYGNQLKLPAQRDKLDEVLAFVDSVLAPYDVDTKTLNRIHIALDEIFTNVASYAYGGKPGLAVIECDVTDDVLKLRIIDGGVAYNPLAQPEPDTSLKGEDRPIGGLGIFLAKKLMDGMDYERSGGMNRVTLTKKLR